jgi:hypothetical protein
MKRVKRTFTQGEKDLVFDLWKQGTGFSDIGKVLEAAPGTVFTASILNSSGYCFLLIFTSLIVILCD